MAGILLVHGGWHGPWCWDGFVERLRRRGHQVLAVRLCGHDGPAGRIWHRVHHYVQDVAAAAARFAEPPVLVGHSMGGLAVQKDLERGPAPGMILLATFPRRGDAGGRRPPGRPPPGGAGQGHRELAAAPAGGQPGAGPGAVLRPVHAPELVEEVWGRVQDESYLAFLDTMVVWARPRRVRVPVLVPA
jgi:pimeloyl-ACP methyl ester carboxylesterase